LSLEFKKKRIKSFGDSWKKSYKQNSKERSRL